MDRTNSEQSSDNPLPWLVHRPLAMVAHLPHRYRWEFTRRHPYYQMFWNIGETTSALPEILGNGFDSIAELILAAVNVSFQHVISPETEWDDLSQEESWSVWQEGAVARIQLKGLVASLIGVLSRDSLKSVAMQLWQASQLDESDTNGEYKLLKAVIGGEFPGFDDYLPDLIVTLQPEASEKAISQGVKSIVRQYQQDHNTPKHRLHIAKFDDYLRVWDLREGWCNGRYVHTKQHTLEAASAILEKDTRTLCDRYKCAFKLITGQDYSPDMWRCIIGNFKLTGLLGTGGGLRIRRGGRTRSVAGTSDSAFSESGSFLAETTTEHGPAGLDQLINQEELHDLRSDMPIDEIIRRHDLAPSCKQMIEDYRRQYGEIT